MAGGAYILEDDSLLSHLDQGILSIERRMAIICGLAVLLLMFLAMLSVSGRTALNKPLVGYIDWIEQIMPLIAFLAISYTQREGGHIRMDILVARLKGRTLWAFEFLTTFAVLILIVFLLFGSWAHFERSFDFTRPLWSNDSSIDISLPLWPAKLLAPIAFSILCFRLLVQIVGYGRAFVLNLSEPVAVPLVQSAASQAAEEARHVSDDDS